MKLKLGLFFGGIFLGLMLGLTFQPVELKSTPNFTFKVNHLTGQTWVYKPYQGCFVEAQTQ